MDMTRFQKITLALAGVTALAIGAFILVVPQAFYAGYGIVLGTDAALLSELRAPAANLAALGLLMLAGLVHPRWAPMAKVLALTVFIAFPVGRFVGILLDGVPPDSVLAALGIELAIGTLCLLAFVGGRRGRRTPHDSSIGSPG